MLAQYLLTFREVLEAALLTAIILAFLTRTGRSNLARFAWYGVFGAVGVSLVLGSAIWLAYGTLSKANQVLFEGLAALLAVGVLTSMIYWMAVKGRELKSVIETRVQAAVTQGTILALMSLTFILVFREGLETVLFLTPYLVGDALPTVAGAALGLAFGVGLAFLIFRVGMKLDLRKFFYFTSILLVLVAGGLVGYGVHELVEYGQGFAGAQLGWWGEQAFNLGIPSDSPFHNKGIVGSIFAVMLGYDTDPEWARVVAHAAYLAVVLPLVVLVYRRPDFLRNAVARVRGVFRPESSKVPADSRE